MIPAVRLARKPALTLVCGGSVTAVGNRAMATRRAFLKTAAFGTAYLFSSRARAADLTSSIQSRMDDYCARTLVDTGANVAISMGVVAPEVGSGAGQLIF